MASARWRAVIKENVQPVPDVYLLPGELAIVLARKDIDPGKMDRATVFTNSNKINII